MTSGKSLQRYEESLFLGGLESVLCDALMKPPERVKRRVNSGCDSHGPKYRCTARHPCVPNVR